jgi:phosphoglycerate dehydrogenase-like enzyme
VLVPAGAPVEAMGELPDGVEVVAVPGEGPLPGAVGAARMLVAGPPLAPPRLREVFAAAPALEVVQSTAAGNEWLFPLVPAGVTVANASSVHDGPVAEWCAAVILAMERRLPAFWALQGRGEWDADVNTITARGASPIGPIDDLDGKTVLLLGHGAIGRALEARLAPFGVRTVGVSRTGERTLADVPALLPGADVVVVLLPLTDATAGIVDAAFLDAMKPGALLVNAARGGHVDQDALLERLHAGRVRAALDVTSPEPLPAGHPLWRAPGVLITPHVAGSAERWVERAYRLAGDQVRRLVAGEPLHSVRTAGY